MKVIFTREVVLIHRKTHESVRLREAAEVVVTWPENLETDQRNLYGEEVDVIVGDWELARGIPVRVVSR